jgi:hypothetical protein
VEAIDKNPFQKFRLAEEEQDLGNAAGADDQVTLPNARWFGRYGD